LSLKHSTIPRNLTGSGNMSIHLSAAVLHMHLDSYQLSGTVYFWLNQSFTFHHPCCDTKWTHYMQTCQVSFCSLGI